jgi:hypothetical protein
MRPHRPANGPTNASDSYGGSSIDAAMATALAALEFLERSRDVANEVVVDGTRSETSTSRREETTDPHSGSSV